MFLFRKKETCTFSETIEQFFKKTILCRNIGTKDKNFTWVAFFHTEIEPEPLIAFRLCYNFEQ